MKRKLTIALLVLSIITLLSLQVYAHNSSQVDILDHETDNGHTIIGSESIGWIIDESMHLGSSVLTYRFSNTVTQTQKNSFYAAISIWSNAYPYLSFTESSSGLLYITTNNANNGKIATTSGATNSNGHFTSATITINNYYSSYINPVSLAHEIGHVIGLNDLYDDGNDNKIMYGYYGTSATAPATEEIWGVSILQNRHGNTGYEHDWKYTNAKKTCSYCGGVKTEQHHYVWTQYNATYHKGTCTDCGAIVYERHYHYYNNILGCLRCGYNGPVPQAILDPTSEE